MTVSELIKILADWSPLTEVEIGHPDGVYPIGSVSYEEENLITINVQEGET